MIQQVTFRAMLDAGVPDSVGHILKAHGHEVIFHRDVLPDGSTDLVVAATALANEAVLVAIDKDMKQLAQRYGITARGDRFARLSIIRLCCNETLAAKRLDHVMNFVMLEWAVSLELAARRMWVEISEHHIRSNR